jgi:hypothetical protein
VGHFVDAHPSRRAFGPPQDEIRTMSAIKPNSTANVEEPYFYDKAIKLAIKGIATNQMKKSSNSQGFSGNMGR